MISNFGYPKPAERKRDSHEPIDHLSIDDYNRLYNSELGYVPSFYPKSHELLEHNYETKSIP